MTTVRKSAVSGIFYPDQELDLQSKVQELLSEAPVYSLRPTAIVVPHSSLSYSGKIAASAYASLAQFQDEIKDVIVLGSSHHNAVKGVVVCTYQEFECSARTVKTNPQILNKIKGLDFVSVDDSVHDGEHSIEVQLPFLNEVLSDYSITPLAVGEVDPSDVARLMETVVSPQALFVISTDFSQYMPYEEAKEADKETLKSIELLDKSGIDSYKACNHIALKGLLEYAKLTKSSMKNLCYENSGDTGDNKDRVIGYISSYCLHGKEDLAATIA